MMIKNVSEELFFCFLERFIPLEVMGRMLEPLPAAYVKTGSFPG